MVKIHRALFITLQIPVKNLVGINATRQFHASFIDEMH
jgi:hypothetical protein